MIFKTQAKTALLNETKAISFGRIRNRAFGA